MIVHKTFFNFAFFLSAFQICKSRKDVGSTKSTSLLSTFHIGSRFCFFPIFLSHPHTLIRIVLFHDVQKTFPIWKPSPKRTSKESSQIAFPITVLPKDDHTDFVQEERLGRPYWTMILAICVVVDESECLDIPFWEFTICEHLPFYLVIT